MSAYKRIATQFKDRECLLEALKRAGVPFEVAQKGQRLHLYGYEGDRRRETAEFVVRRKHIGPASNDLGYVWNAQAGAYEAIVSDYDTRCAATTRIRKQIKRQYAVSKVVKEARRKPGVRDCAWCSREPSKARSTWFCRATRGKEVSDGNVYD